MMPIWTIYSHLPSFEKYFPRKAGLSNIQYQYDLLQIPGLISTKLTIDDSFLLLSDDELRSHVIPRIYVLKNRKNIRYFTRLSCFYFLQLSKETKEEFYEYIDRFRLKIVCRILSTLPFDKEYLVKDYFALRWKKHQESYRQILAEMSKIDEHFYHQYSEKLLLALFEYYTKENNENELEYLISLGEKHEEGGDVFPWISALVPYGSREMIRILLEKEDLEVINLIYDTSLEVNERRLKEIIETINDFSISYQAQLDQYLDAEDWESSDPGYEHSNLKNFMIIVSNLAKLGNIDIRKISIREGSKLEIFLNRTENQV